MLSLEIRADGIFYSRSSSSLEAWSNSVFDRENRVPSPPLPTAARALNRTRVQLWWYSKGQDIICNVGHVCHMKSAEQWYFAPWKFTSNYFVVFHTHSKCVCPEFHFFYMLYYDFVWGSKRTGELVCCWISPGYIKFFDKINLLGASM